MEVKEKETIETVVVDAEVVDDNHKHKMKEWVRVCTAIGLVVALCLAVVLLYPFVEFFQTGNQVQLREHVEGMGVFGYVSILLMQILQVVVALIPGAVVQLVVGYMFDVWLGLAICLVGVYIGQMINFRLVRRFGHNFVEAVANGDALKRWSFIRDEKKLEFLAFILFFIPGLPKDLLCYIFPLTTIKESRFMLITVLTRIPAIATSILAADYLYEGKIITAAIIWCAIALVSIVAILLSNKLIKTWKSHSETR